MTPVTLNKSSRLWYFLTTYGFVKPWETDLDTCFIVRRFVLGVLWCMTIILVGAWVGYILVVTPILYLIYSYVDGMFLPLFDNNTFPMLGGAIITYSAVVGVLLWCYLTTLFEKYERHDDQPSVLMQSLSNWKSKICARIIVK